MIGSERPGRHFEVGDRRWVLFDARRTASGTGLGYFLPAGDMAPAARGDDDRRVLLQPDTSVERIGVAAVRGLWEQAVPLTPTECRIVVGESVWLVQATGPVWSERASAADATGARAVCLSHEAAVRLIRRDSPNHDFAADPGEVLHLRAARWLKAELRQAPASVPETE